MKHTQGPWKRDPYIVERKDNSVLIFKTDEDYHLIATVHRLEYDLTGKELAANARLISNAPILLAAAHKLLIIAEGYLEIDRIPEIEKVVHETKKLIREIESENTYSW